ncbi:MAG TPA: polysaccharide deacetylase family protein [Gaiellaceae bacterium]
MPRAALLLGLLLLTGCGSAKRQAIPAVRPAAPPVAKQARPRHHRLVTAHNRAVPILMYHVVANAPAGVPFPGLFVRRADFTGQLRWLARHGYHPVLLQQVYDYWRYGYALPPRPVVLSFDDGYRADYDFVRPQLLARHWRAVLNLVVRNALDGALPTGEARTLRRDGWEIDAHTLTHRDLTTLAPAELQHEVAGSRAWIKAHVGGPVDFFCYPAGRYDAQAIAAVRAAGFLAATTTQPGVASPRNGLFTLERIRVDGSDGVSGFAAKMSAAAGG